MTFEEYFLLHQHQPVDEGLKSYIAPLVAAAMLPFQGLSAPTQSKAPAKTAITKKQNKKPAPKIVKFTDEQANSADNIIIATVLGEARDQGVEGMTAILNVIRNRMITANVSNYKKAKQIVLSPKQFSIWNDKQTVKERTAFVNQMRATPQWETASKLFQLFKTNKLKDTTKGATFYHRYNASPEWKDVFTKTNTINKHIFYTHGDEYIKPFLPKQKVKEDIDTPNNGFVTRPVGGPNIVNFSPNFKPPVGIYLKSDQIHVPTLQLTKLNAIRAIRRRKAKKS